MADTTTNQQETDVQDTTSVSTSQAINTLLTKWEEKIKELKVFSSELRALKKEVMTLEKEKDKLSKSKKKKRESSGDKKPSGFAVPQPISDELAEFLGLEKGVNIARTEVTKHLTTYIKENDLKDPENKRNIVLTSDAGKKLKAILSPLVDPDTNEPVQLSYFNLQRYIKHHFPASKKATEAKKAEESEVPVKTTKKKVVKKVVKKAETGEEVTAWKTKKTKKFLNVNLSKQAGESESDRQNRIEYILNAQDFVGYDEAIRLSYVYNNVKKYKSGYDEKLMEKMKKYIK